MITEMLGQSGRGVWSTEQSVTEFAQAFDRPITQCNAREASQCDPAESAKRDRAYWYGSDSIRTVGDVRAILDGGWSEGADRLTDLARDLGDKIPAAQSRKRKQVWRDEGADLDVDRALADRWDVAYRASRRVYRPGPTAITITSPFGGIGGYSAADLFWCGASLVVLCDVLETAGYRVQVVAATCITSQETEDYFYGRVVLKDFAEAMRIDAIAAVTCHAAIYRTFSFRDRLAAPFKIGDGLGQSVSSDRMLHRLESVGAKPEGIFLERAYSKSDAVREINRVLAQINPTSAE